MRPDGERIATLEQAVRDLSEDVQELSAQVERSRGRLHDLEGFAHASLELQKQHRRLEQRQYQKIAQSIQFGSLIMAAAMVCLSVVTLAAHL